MWCSNVRLLPKPRPGTETKGGLGHNDDADSLQRVVRTCRQLLEPMRQKRWEAFAMTSEWGGSVNLWKFHCMQMIPHIPVLSYIVLHSYKDQTASNTKLGIKNKQPTSLHWKLSQNSYWHIYWTIWGFTERMTIPKHLVQRSRGQQKTILTKHWSWVSDIDANSQLLSH